jgi:hypothetical protein
MLSTYARDPLPDLFNQLLHINVLPSSWEVNIPVAWVGLPPKRRIYCGPATKNALEVVLAHVY